MKRVDHPVVLTFANDLFCLWTTGIRGFSQVVHGFFSRSITCAVLVFGVFLFCVGDWERGYPFRARREYIYLYIDAYV